MFIDWIAIHKRAVAYANSVEPKFELDTPEHAAWLKAYDEKHRDLTRTALRESRNTD